MGSRCWVFRNAAAKGPFQVNANSGQPGGGGVRAQVQEGLQGVKASDTCNVV